MTGKLCPKCGGIMSKYGKARRGKELKQRWLCGRTAGCGYVQLTKLEEGK